MNFIENKYLPSFLILYPGLLHLTLQHNLAVYPSAQMHKSKDHRKNKESLGKQKISIKSL